MPRGREKHVGSQGTPEDAHSVCGFTFKFQGSQYLVENIIGCPVPPFACISVGSQDFVNHFTGSIGGHGQI